MSEFRKGYLDQSEWNDLNQAYLEMLQRKSDGTGSAWGDHYLLVQKLATFGITDIDFEGSGARVENFIEHLLTYNEIPAVF